MAGNTPPRAEGQVVGSARIIESGRGHDVEHQGRHNLGFCDCRRRARAVRLGETAFSAGVGTLLINHLAGIMQTWPDPSAAQQVTPTVRFGHIAGQSKGQTFNTPARKRGAPALRCGRGRIIVPNFSSSVTSLRQAGLLRRHARTPKGGGSGHDSINSRQRAARQEHHGQTNRGREDGRPKLLLDGKSRAEGDRAPSQSWPTLGNVSAQAEGYRRRGGPPFCLIAARRRVDQRPRCCAPMGGNHLTRIPFKLQTR